MIWTRMFLQEQGFILEENVLHQDNQSAMKVLKNGKRSSGQKTKHMDNRFFWIKDRIESEGIEVRYCPTEMMIADFFTKPLQGRLFRKFRDVVLGYKHISTLVDEEESPSQERVGKGIPEGIPEGSGDGISSNGGSANDGSDDSTNEKRVTWAEIVKGNSSR